jgi:chromosome segregation ATPase
MFGITGEMIQEMIIKGWVGIFSLFIYPIVRWINNKRKEWGQMAVKVESLGEEVQDLKHEVGKLEAKVDSRFDKLMEAQKERDDKREQKDERLWEELTSIKDTCHQIQKETAVNKARIDSVK